MDNGAIYMLDIQNFIGKTSTEADRKKVYRAKIATEKEALSINGQMSRQTIRQTYTRVRVKEKERERERERIYSRGKFHFSLITI